MDSGCWIPDSTLQIPDSKTKKITDFSFWFAPNCRISSFFREMTSIVDLVIEGHVNVCLSVHISITTFDNYKKCITAN